MEFTFCSKLHDIYTSKDQTLSRKELFVIKGRCDPFYANKENQHIILYTERVFKLYNNFSIHTIQFYVDNAQSFPFYLYHSNWIYIQFILCIS